MINEKEVAENLRNQIIKESNTLIDTTEVIKEVDSQGNGYYVIHLNIPLNDYPNCGLTIYVVDGQVSLMSFPVVKNVGDKKDKYLNLCNIVNESRDHYTFFYSSQDDSIRVKTSYLYNLNKDSHGNLIFINNDFLNLQVYEAVLAIGRIWCIYLDNM